MFFFVSTVFATKSHIDVGDFSIPFITIDSGTLHGTGLSTSKPNNFHGTALTSTTLLGRVMAIGSAYAGKVIDL